MLKDHSTELRDELLSKRPSLPKLAVAWEEDKQRVSMFSLGGAPYDFVLASSKDSAKGEIFEEIARRANSYPRLVEALRKCRNGYWDALGGNDDADNRERAVRLCKPFDTLLRSLGESEEKMNYLPSAESRKDLNRESE